MPKEENVTDTSAIEAEIQKLKKDLGDLNDEFYRNNFSAGQDFNKYSRFNTRLKIPHKSALPSTCEVSEICEYNGKLYVCSAANTWTIVGTQS